jgi:hypothetical protein
MRRALAPSAPRALLLDKSVGNKFPKFTVSYPNRGAGGRAPTFGRGTPAGVLFGACNVRLCERFTGFGRVLAGFLAD